MWVALLLGGLGAIAIGAAISASMLRRADARSTHLAEELSSLRGAYELAIGETRDREIALQSMQEGLALFREDGSVSLANDALGRHLERTPQGLSSLLPLALREAVTASREDGRLRTIEFEFGVPSRWLRAAAVPTVGTGSVLLVVSDINESKRLDAVRRDFVANASHELKTPAAAIQATAETLRHAASDDPAAVARFAEQLQRETYRLSRMVADLLDLSRLESGSERGDRVRVDAVAREEVERFAEMADAARIDLSVDAPRAVFVRGSSRDLSLLIRNLVDNAVRHTKADGTVGVSVRSEGNTAVIEVVDTGIGIPTRELPRIFERFYRVDRARSRETGGTGLGLAIVRHVAENHAGSVGVQSELGEGSTFTVRLPVDRIPA